MHLDSEVCIVGAGPAGLSIASELADRGIMVTVLESGGLSPSLNAQGLSAGEYAGYPYHKLDRALFSGIGGSAQLWTGSNRFRPLDGIDFEERPGVPHSGWPFGLTHLMPYYERAQTLLPLGPFDYTADFWEQPGSTPRLPLPADKVETAIFQTTPQDDSGARAIADLASDASYRIMTETTVTELLASEDGTRIDTAQLRHSDGTESRLNARIFVLAAGGLDNARLLMVSNKRWAHGLGNANGLVGRFFMEHPAVSTAYWVPSDPALFERSALYKRHVVRGTSVVGTLTVAEEVKRHEGLLNAAVFVQMSDELRVSDIYGSLAMFSPEGLKNMRWSSSIYAENLANLVRHPLKSLSTLVKVAVKGKRGRPGVFALRVVSEQAPNPESRLFLDSKLDKKGLPQLRLDWRFTELDRWSIRRTQEILRDSFDRAGLGSVTHLYGEERPEALIYGQRHQMGTTRMHRDPEKGVVDANCKVHGLHNLFVAGSSAFPTGGHANPTLTIVALALRLADHIGGLFENRRGVGEIGSRESTQGDGPE